MAGEPNGRVTDDMSRDPERSKSWPQYACAISRKQMEMLFSNNRQLGYMYSTT